MVALGVELAEYEFISSAYNSHHPIWYSALSYLVSLNFNYVWRPLCLLLSTGVVNFFCTPYHNKEKWLYIRMISSAVASVLAVRLVSRSCRIWRRDRLNNDSRGFHAIIDTVYQALIVCEPSCNQAPYTAHQQYRSFEY